HTFLLRAGIYFDFVDRARTCRTLGMSTGSFILFKGGILFVGVSGRSAAAEVVGDLGLVVEGQIFPTRFAHELGIPGLALGLTVPRGSLLMLGNTTIVGIGGNGRISRQTGSPGCIGT